MFCRGFFVGVDEFVDGFGNRQVVIYQAARLVLWIINLINVVVEICQSFIDLIQINIIGIKL